MQGWRHAREKENRTYSEKVHKAILNLVDADHARGKENETYDDKMHEVILNLVDHVMRIGDGCNDQKVTPALHHRTPSWSPIV